MADLSTLIPDPAGAGSGSYSVSPGVKMLNLSPDGSWRRIPPVTCLGCQKIPSGEHKADDGMEAIPSNKAKLWAATLEGHANDLRDYLELIRTLIHLMHRQAYGVRQDGFPVGFVPASNSYFWDLVSITNLGDGSSKLTVKYQAGDADPRILGATSFGLNTDFGLPGETRFTGTSIATALVPGGIARFTNPSQLKDHGGLIVFRAVISETLAVNDNFDLYVLGGDISGAIAASKWPVADPLPVRIEYRAFVHTAEPYLEIRDSANLYCIRKTVAISSPVAGENTVAATKRWRFAETGWFSATWTKTGPGVEDKTSAFMSKLEVRHVGAAGYETILDLTGVDLTSVTKVTVIGWEESTDDKAIPVGQKHCRHATRDPSGTWGEAEAAGEGRSYCSKRNTASQASQYRADDDGGCYMPNFCDGWTHEAAPTNPVDQGVLAQVIASIPWLIRQPRSISDFTLSRNGTPSLLALVLPMALPVSSRDVVLKSLECGAWSLRLTIGDQQARLYGLEWTEVRAVGSAALVQPDLRDAEASLTNCPIYGPGGGNWGPRIALRPSLLTGERLAHFPLRASEEAMEIGAGKEDRLGDLHSSIMSGSVMVHAHASAEVSTLGEIQKIHDITSVDRYRVWFSQINVPQGAPQVWSDGTLTAGMFLVLGNSYLWKLEISPRRREMFGGTKKTAKIAAVQGLIGGRVAFWLELGQEHAASEITVAGKIVDRRTVWMQGGNVCHAPDWLRVRNYATGTQSYGTDRGKVMNGDVARFTNGNGFTRVEIKDRRFWVREAVAFADDAHKGSFEPGQFVEVLQYHSGGRVFFAFDTAAELVTSLVIKRNAGAVTLAEAANNEEVKPQGTSSEMAIDVYYWEYSGDRNGIYIHFSPNQVTADPADFAIIDIDVTTDKPKTYVTKFLNLKTDATEGWDNTIKQTLTASENIISVTGVRVFRRNGAVDTCSVYSVRPTNWSDWVTSKFFAGTISGLNVDIEVSPEYAGDVVEVTLDLGAPGLTGLAYYDANVNFHRIWERLTEGTAVGALPAGHREWANRWDKVVVDDPNGAILAVLLEEGEGYFVGKDLEFRNDGVMHDDGLDIDRAAFDDPAADVDIKAQCLIFSAQGEVLIPDILTDKNCVIVRGRFADRNATPETAELKSLRTTLERMMEF